MTDLEKLKELHRKANARREDEHSGDYDDAVRFEGFCYDALPALIAELEAAREVVEAARAYLFSTQQDRYFALDKLDDAVLAFDQEQDK